MDNNIVVLADFLSIFLTLYFTTYLSWPDWLYFYCSEYFDSFDHYAVCYFPLNPNFISKLEQVHGKRQHEGEPNPRFIYMLSPNFTRYTRITVSYRN